MDPKRREGHFFNFWRSQNPHATYDYAAYDYAVYDYVWIREDDEVR